jgi:1,4-dihydroxy-2-naphthoate octaprenyltransferase
MFFTLESDLRLWENLQRAGMEGAKDISISKLRAGIITSAIWFAVVGLLSLTSGVGIFFLKNWARLLWLGALILLAGINLYSLLSEYRRDILGTGDIIGYFIIGVVIVFMWIYFRRLQTKNFFTVQKISNE